MKLQIVVFSSILTWVHFAHCQSEIEVLILEVRQLKNDVLKGMQDLQLKQNEMLEKVQGYEDLRQQQNNILEKLTEMQKKLDHVESNLQELHRDLEHVKGTVKSNQDSLQNMWEKLETTLEGTHQVTKNCLQREDLESFKNILSAGQRELESSLRQEISGFISSLETGGIDECSEGSHDCGDHEACTDKLFKYACHCIDGFARNGERCEDIDECAQGKAECSPHAACRNSVGSYNCSCNPPFEGDGRTCSCPPGFAQNGSHCDGIDECVQGKTECSPHAACREGDGRTCSCPPGFAQNGSHCDDIDECAQGKAECSPQAACRNSVGSYICSCKPPFEGDGRTCEFSCKSPAEVIEGLGCVKLVMEWKTWQEMNATCQEAGWRLLQDLTDESLQEVVRAFSHYGRWIGLYEGKWLESGIPLQEGLWWDGDRADPSMRCGVIDWDDSSSSANVAQRDCSDKRRGYCQSLVYNHLKNTTSG